MSDSDIVQAAKAELERVQAQLEETPLFKKMTSLQQLIALYEPGAPAIQHMYFPWNLKVTDPSECAVAVHRAAHSASIKYIVREAVTKTAQIEAAAVKYLARKKARATSGELVNVMADAGIEISGKEPNKALSAYLSGMGSLNNVREYGGYGLVEWGQGAGPDLLTKSGA